jgi:hypothetical protein
MVNNNKEKIRFNIEYIFLIYILPNLKKEFIVNEIFNEVKEKYKQIFNKKLKLTNSELSMYLVRVTFRKYNIFFKNKTINYKRVYGFKEDLEK